ncbi:MAG: glycosyltransferase family 4 protein [Cellvibrionaceae bacterium]|nr:glycosyltransferase family 4 protein [Cellvibrionaceae bacterium]
MAAFKGRVCPVERFNSSAPSWVSVIHINSWLHRRFIPSDLPVVATFHHCVHDRNFSPYKSKAQKIYHRYWIKGIESYVAKRADSVTAVSQYTAQKIKDVFGCDDISVIYNWVDPSVFKSSQQREKRDKFRLLFVGSLSVRKGADLLPKIMASLGDGFELWHTRNADEMPGYPDLPQNIKSIGWLESENELVQAYQRCDALLFPSRLEGFGYAVLEAQTCGLPVVCTNGSSLSELVIDGETGLLFNQDDVNAAVGAVKRLAEDAGLRQRLSIQAKHQAEQRFNRNAAMDSYIKLYTTLASKKR